MNVFDQEIMARTAIGEARGEMIDGMQAVMWTGMNRFNAKKWFSGTTIAGTFLKRLQYDCWRPDDINFQIITNLTADAGLLKSALNWAAGIIQSVIPDHTNGATHYFDDSIDPPSWTQGAEMTVKIGRLSFYRGVS